MDAVPVQGLSFGALIPGVPETVSVGDPARRAEVVLKGEGWLDLSLLLPEAMLAPSGARIPLRFEGHDGAILRSSSSSPALLDPRGMHRIRLGGEHGPMKLLLGGTALPAMDLPAGKYTTTIVLIVTTPGT